MSEELEAKGEKRVPLICSLTEEQKKLVLQAWEEAQNREKRGYIEFPIDRNMYAELTTEEIGRVTRMPRANLIQTLASWNGKREDFRDILLSIKEHSPSTATPPEAGFLQRTIWFSEWAREYENWFKGATLRDALQRWTLNFLPEVVPLMAVTGEGISKIAEQFESLESSLFEEDTFSEFLAEICVLMSKLVHGNGFKVDSLAVITLMAACYQRRHSKFNDFIFGFKEGREKPPHLFCLDVLELAIEDGYIGQVPGTQLFEVGPKGRDLAEHHPCTDATAPVTEAQGVQVSREDCQVAPPISTKVQEIQDKVVSLPPWFVPDLPKPFQRLLQALERAPAGLSARELKDELGGMQPSRAKPKGKRYAKWIAHFEKWIDHRRNCYRLRTIDEVKSRGPV